MAASYSKLSYVLKGADISLSSMDIAYGNLKICNFCWSLLRRTLQRLFQANSVFLPMTIANVPFEVSMLNFISKNLKYK
jgi:hypothetical protein